MPSATLRASFSFLAASARLRVVQSAICPVRELAIRELAYPRVVQLPTGDHSLDVGGDAGPVDGLASTALARVDTSVSHVKSGQYVLARLLRDDEATSFEGKAAAHAELVGEAVERSQIRRDVGCGVGPCSLD